MKKTNQKKKRKTKRNQKSNRQTKNELFRFHFFLLLFNKREELITMHRPIPMIREKARHASYIPDINFPNQDYESPCEGRSCKKRDFRYLWLSAGTTDKSHM